MKLSDRFNVVENRIHFGYMDFAGYIEAKVKHYGGFIDDVDIVYVVSITKNGVDFIEHNYETLEDAFKFLEEYNQQMIAERCAEYGQK